MMFTLKVMHCELAGGAFWCGKSDLKDKPCSGWPCRLS